MLLLAVVGAAFTASAAPPASSLTAVSLDTYVPASVTASRLNASTCRVTWTASAASGAPGSLTYDVTDGTTTLATGVSGLTTDLTTSADITPRVAARAGTWVSSTATTAAASCGSPPGAPTGLTLTPGNAQLAATWTAPASTGGSAITGYTATASPGGATCTTTGTSCTITALTNGTTYTVTVTATNAAGTGPASTAATGTPYSCTPGTASATSDYDAYIDQSVPTGNFNSNQLSVQSFNTSNQRTFVHFALPSLPAGCSVTSATLTFTVGYTTATGRTLQLYRAASSWTETGLTWSGQPAATGTASTTTSASGSIQFSVTSHVQALYSGSNHGFVIRDSVEGASSPNRTQVFNSRENAGGKPTLSITYG